MKSAAERLRRNYTAFARADVEDAKRGRPDRELREYAAARGLEWLDRAKLAGFRGAQPKFPEYQFNLMRGALPGGTYGILLHELFEIRMLSGETAMSGTFYSTRYRSPGGRLSALVGGLKQRPPEPFQADAVWAPCTVAAVHVPEAKGVLPWLAIEPKSRYDLYTQRQAREFGEHMMRSDPEIRDHLAARILAGPVAEAVGRFGDGYFTIDYDRGTLRLRKNGYLVEPAALDGLAGAAVAIGRHLAEVSLPLTEPRSVDEPLRPRPGWDGVEPPEDFAERFRDLAARLRLEHEDPVELHRAFPSLPAPGLAVAVMRGELPGTARQGRLVYYADRPVSERLKVRGGVVMRAADGVEPTAPGGVRLADRKLVYEVRDGILSIWSTESWGWRFSEEDTILERAVALAQERSLYA